MGGKNSAPPPPDYTPIEIASQNQMQTSQDQLDLANKQFAAQQEASDKAYQLSSDQFDWAKQQYAADQAQNQQVIDADIDTQTQQNAAAAAAQKRYETVFQPLEDQMVANAKDYNSPSRKDMAMGAASSGVAQAYDGQRQAALSNLESFGIDPSSTRYAALDIGTRSSQAAAQAGAANQAGLQTDATGLQLLSDAVNLGRGYPSQVASGYATGNNAGNSAVNSGLATTASGANTQGTAPTYYGLGTQSAGVGTGALGAGTAAAGVGNSALSIWGNTLNNGYNNQLGQYNANQASSSGIGSLLGTAGALALHFADGGEVPSQGGRGGADSSGPIPKSASPSRGKAIDDVPARLNAGEFVLPKDYVAWKGEEFIQKQIQKAREDRKENSPAKPQMKQALPLHPAVAMARMHHALKVA